MNPLPKLYDARQRLWVRKEVETKQSMKIHYITLHYIRYIEARSCNHCCSGKEIAITYSECVFVDLGT